MIALTGGLCKLPDSTASSTVLSQARDLDPPDPTVTAGGETEGAAFWERHGDVLRRAWDAWAGAADLPELYEGDVIHGPLRSAVDAAWSSPSPGREGAVRSLLHEVVPGVHGCRLLGPDGIGALRAHLDAVSASGIPSRRPNGMNRRGIVVDDGGEPIDGAVAVPELLAFRKMLVDRYGKYDRSSGVAGVGPDRTCTDRSIFL